MIGKRYGAWVVLSINNKGPWPWALIKSDKGHYGRVSVSDLEVFNSKDIGE